ncbi:hypothetical protein J6Y50_10920, partial [bacterium]|nr:hypothetical protein [bacterium]
VVLCCVVLSSMCLQNKSNKKRDILGVFELKAIFIFCSPFHIFPFQEFFGELFGELLVNLRKFLTTFLTTFATTS